MSIYQFEQQCPQNSCAFIDQSCTCIFQAYNEQVKYHNVLPYGAQRTKMTLIHFAVNAGPDQPCR